MKPSSPVVQISIALPRSDYATYRAAARQLSRAMGPQAPTVPELLTHTLLRRDSQGLAEDYLESVGWPLGPGTQNGDNAGSRNVKRKCR